MGLSRLENMKDYTVVSSAVLNNVRLSWRAKGLWKYLMSQPADELNFIRDLMDRSYDRMVDTYSALVELMDFGYVQIIDMTTYIISDKSVNTSDITAVKKSETRNEVH